MLPSPFLFELLYFLVQWVTTIICSFLVYVLTEVVVVVVVVVVAIVAVVVVAWWWWWWRWRWWWCVVKY